MKATLHCGKRGSANHNDRQFDPRVSGDHHIDADRMVNNIYSSYKNIAPFAEAERAFYEDTYSEWIDAQNKKYLAHREAKKLKSVDKLLASKNTKPDEIILQIGDSKNNPGETVFSDCVSDFVEALAHYAQNFHIIDIAVHNDEATPHAHVRAVWDYTDKDGLKKISKNNGLKELGFEPPNPDLEIGKYNNRNIPFMSEIREKWYDICEEHGLTIDRTPILDNQQHLEKNELTLKMQEERIRAQEEQIRALDEEIAEKQERLMQLERAAKEREEYKKMMKEKLERELGM